MLKEINKVESFHKAFNQPIRKELTMLTPEERELRVKLIQEELDELNEALKDGDMIEAVDALGDICYLVFGTAALMGCNQVLQQAFDEIHESNMSKLGKDGKPVLRSDGKIIKGPNYFPPEIGKIINQFRNLPY